MGALKVNNVEIVNSTANIISGVLPTVSGVDGTYGSGANGVTLDYSPIRHLANIESVFTYEGTHEMHTLIIGEDITGISAFE